MYFGEYYFALAVYSYRTFEENVRPKDPSENRVFGDSRDQNVRRKQHLPAAE